VGNTPRHAKLQTIKRESAQAIAVSVLIAHYFHKRQPFYVYQLPVFTSPLTVGETLRILISPDLKDGTTTLPRLRGSLPELIPDSCTRVPNEDPSFRFQQPA